MPMRAFLGPSAGPSKGQSSFQTLDIVAWGYDIWGSTAIRTAMKAQSEDKKPKQGW